MAVKALLNNTNAAFSLEDQSILDLLVKSDHVVEAWKITTPAPPTKAPEVEEAEKLIGFEVMRGFYSTTSAKRKSTGYERQSSHCDEGEGESRLRCGQIV